MNFSLTPQGMIRGPGATGTSQGMTIGQEEMTRGRGATGTPQGMTIGHGVGKGMARGCQAAGTDE